MYRGEALDRFLEGTATADSPDHVLPQFPAVLFWIAVDVGLPAEQAGRLRAAVALMDERRQGVAGLTGPLDIPAQAWRDHTVRAEDPWKDLKEAHGWPELQAFWQAVPLLDRPGYYAACKAVADQLPGTAGHKVFKAAMHDTARFSFAAR